MAHTIFHKDDQFIFLLSAKCIYHKDADHKSAFLVAFLLNWCKWKILWKFSYNYTSEYVLFNIFFVALENGSKTNIISSVNIHALLIMCPSKDVSLCLESDILPFDTVCVWDIGRCDLLKGKVLLVSFIFLWLHSLSSCVEGSSKAGQLE